MERIDRQIGMKQENIIGQPLVSVVISAYNSSLYIADTIRSFLCQTYCNWEMTVIDDGSQDNTLEIVRSLADKDSRVKYIHQDNAGMTNARKTGIDMSSGKYLLIFDSDDILYADALETLVSIAENSGADAVSIPFRFWYPDGHKEDSFRPDYDNIDGIGYLERAFMGKAYWALWTYFVRREAMSKVDFNVGKDLRLGEDMVITVQIMDCRTKIVACPKPLVDYRIRTESVSRKITPKFYKDLRRSMDISEALLEQDGIRYRKLRRSLAAARLTGYLSGIYMGDDSNVADDLHRSLRYLFRYPSLWIYLKKKDISMVRLMRKYIFFPKKAISKAYQIAYTNRNLK